MYYGLQFKVHSIIIIKKPSLISALIWKIPKENHKVIISTHFVMS